MVANQNASSAIAELERSLNEMLTRGELRQAFELFYDQDVVIQENSDEPRIGKEANQQHRQCFLNSIEHIHSIEVKASADNEDVSFAEWFIDATFRNCVRRQRRQVTRRRWKNGKVVHERFFFAG